MEQTVKERLVNYLKYKRMGQNKFEALCGIARGYISHLKNAPGTEQLMKILNAAPDLNKEWLMTGQGEMLNDSNVIPVVIPDNDAAEVFHTTANGMRYLKRDDGQLLMEVSVVPIAALGSPDDEFAQINNNYTDDKLLIEVDSIHHGRYFAFRVEGDSMDDGTRRSFEAGDTVIVRELPRDEWMPKLHLRDWPFWVVVFNNCVRIKQIIRQDPDNGDITLHSLNPSPEYTDFTLPLSSISRLFNVVRHQPKEIVWK